MAYKHILIAVDLSPESKVLVEKAVSMARYFSSLRALLVVLRGCDPLLYQYVDGGGFFYLAWATEQADASGVVYLRSALPRSS